METAGQPEQLTARVAQTLDPSWSALAAVRVGAFYGATGAPDDYVLVANGPAPFLRVDVYHARGEYHLRCEAEIWRDRVIIGFSQELAFVPLHGGAAGAFPLSETQPTSAFDYFCHLYCDADQAFATSGRRVFRLGADGSILWISREVGIDGVLVHDIAGGIVSGDGEWGSPCGWQPFRLSLETGALLIDGL